MSPIEFFHAVNIDTKTFNSGSHYLHCPLCHDARKKKNSKELLVNFDTSYVHCYHCGWEPKMWDVQQEQKGKRYTPPPPKPQKFITSEPNFNWKIPDTVVDPIPSRNPGELFYVTWYYRNIKGQLTGAKKMEYRWQEDGFKRTENIPLHLYTRDAGYQPCLFFERDLYLFPHAKVILVESEKTAGILRRMFEKHLNDYIYIATCGARGLSNDKVSVLANREVLIVFDCDKAGREGAEAAHAKLAGISKSVIVDLFPEKDDGTDLADIDVDMTLIRSLSGKSLYLDTIQDILGKHNRAGDFWTRDLASQLSELAEVDPVRLYEMGRVYYETNKHEFGIDRAPLIKKIEYFLLQRYDFKLNAITKEVLFRQKGLESWGPCNYKDIWRILQHNQFEFGKAKIPISDVSNLLESDFVPRFHPFTEYFHSLPQWDGQDHITKLASYIHTTDQEFWTIQFRKALIRMIACCYQNIENRIIMVFVSPKQEQGKDSFIRFICPPELRDYYKEDPLQPNKDTEIALASNFMWNLPELDTLNKKEISDIKGIISRNSIKQRRAYDRQEENMRRTVSFWGSTNKEEFLTDTSNTRWLCFRVLNVSHNYNNYITKTSEVDIKKVWAQAWYLYKSGAEFVLDASESKKRDAMNHSFEHASPEKQLIMKYLTPCLKEDPKAEFMTNAEIQEYLTIQTNRTIRMVPENIGRAMTQLSFESAQKKISKNNVRGYYAIKEPLHKLNGQQPQVQPANPTIWNEVPGVQSEDDETPF